MKVKNISGKKLQIAGHGVCANHTHVFDDKIDISRFIAAGLIKEVIE